MLRLAVISYLVLATLAGPLLCCCNAARIAAMLRSGPEASVCHHGHCCHHGNANQQTDAQRVPSKNTPGPTKPCPCQENRPVAVHVDAASQEIIRQLERGESLLQVLVRRIHLDLGVCSASAIGFYQSQESSAFPHLTGREILHTLQSYLC
jgi:hypothetical protein